MSMFGVPPEISALQSVQAQREAAKARDRSRAALERTRSAREEEERFRVDDTAEISDVRRLDEEANTDDERSRRKRDQHRSDAAQAGDERSLGDGHIDVTA